MLFTSGWLESSIIANKFKIKYVGTASPMILQSYEVQVKNFTCYGNFIDAWHAARTGLYCSWPKYLQQVHQHTLLQIEQFLTYTIFWPSPSQIYIWTIQSLYNLVSKIWFYLLVLFKEQISTYSKNSLRGLKQYHYWNKIIGWVWKKTFRIIYCCGQMVEPLP